MATWQRSTAGGGEGRTQEGDRQRPRASEETNQHDPGHRLGESPAQRSRSAASGEEDPLKMQQGRDELAPAFFERREERLALARHLERNGIRDRRVLAAMAKVPRHAFVPAAYAARAYEDGALPLAAGQTISQPFVVASMTELARLSSTDRCLEIGTGSGYQAAILAEICDSVFSIEYVPELCALGERNLRALGYGPDRVHLRCGDGTRGWPEEAPWDAILVTAAPPEVPVPLLEQLALGGRLVIPVGALEGPQQLEVWERVGEGLRAEAFRRQEHYGVRFVPLVSSAAPS